MNGTAYIVFEYKGRRYEYDGGLPEEVEEQAAHLFDAEGFWLGGYPAELEAQAVDAEDVLPIARWEIEHVGGTIVEIHGARANGAIHGEDWKNPRIY